MIHYSRETENQKAIASAQSDALALTPQNAVILDALAGNPRHASGEHYTFSCLLPDSLRDALRPVLHKLKLLDGELLCTETELLHLTVFWCEIDHDVSRLIEIISSHLKNESLSFTLLGLAALPYGVSIKAYPETDTFFSLREALWNATGKEPQRNQDGSLHEKAVSTWITLGRYIQPPQQELIDYCLEHLNDGFGVFTPENVGAYRVNNKYLRNPEIIGLIPNGNYR